MWPQVSNCSHFKGGTRTLSPSSRLLPCVSAAPSGGGTRTLSLPCPSTPSRPKSVMRQPQQGWGGARGLSHCRAPRPCLSPSEPGRPGGQPFRLRASCLQSPRRRTGSRGLSWEAGPEHTRREARPGEGSWALATVMRHRQPSLFTRMPFHGFSCPAGTPLARPQEQGLGARSLLRSGSALIHARPPWMGDRWPPWHGSHPSRTGSGPALRGSSSSSMRAPCLLLWGPRENLTTRGQQAAQDTGRGAEEAELANPRGRRPWSAAARRTDGWAGWCPGQDGAKRTGDAPSAHLPGCLP